MFPAALEGAVAEIVGRSAEQVGASVGLDAEAAARVAVVVVESGNAQVAAAPGASDGAAGAGGSQTAAGGGGGSGEDGGEWSIGLGGDGDGQEGGLSALPPVAMAVVGGSLLVALVSIGAAAVVIIRSRARVVAATSTQAGVAEEVSIAAGRHDDPTAMMAGYLKPVRSLQVADDVQLARSGELSSSDESD